MQKRLETWRGESGRMAALAVASMNVLIMGILVTSVWLVYSLLEQANRLNDFWRVWTA